MTGKLQHTVTTKRSNDAVLQPHPTSWVGQKTDFVWELVWEQVDHKMYEVLYMVHNYVDSSHDAL